VGGGGLVVGPTNYLLFADTVSRIQAAVAAGSQVVGITTGMSADEMHALPVSKIIRDYQALTLDQITDLIPS